MPLQAEQLVIDSLSDWLRLQLPAEVAAVNATRAAVIKTPTAGPFTIPAGAKLPISLTGPDNATLVPLTAGAARTSTQVATDITAVFPGVPTVDSVGRLVLTSTTAPTASDSGLFIGQDLVTGVPTGANAALGFEPGGERCLRSPLVAPGVKGVADGVPTLPDMGRTFWVVIMDRHTTPVDPQPRRDESTVALELALFMRATANELHRNREAITSCLRCVRGVLSSTSGRQLGRRDNGDVMWVGMGEATVSAVALKVRLSDSAPFELMDVCSQKITVRVFERPANS